MFLTLDFLAFDICSGILDDRCYKKTVGCEGLTMVGHISMTKVSLANSSIQVKYLNNF